MHQCCRLNILFSHRLLISNYKANLTLTLALLALNVYVTLWDKEKCANAQCTVFKFCWTMQSCQLTNTDFPNQHGSVAVEEIRWFSCQEKMFFSPLLFLEAAGHIKPLSLCVKLLNMQILESTWAKRSEEVFLEMFEVEISSCVLWLEIVAGLGRGFSVCVACLSDNFAGVFLVLRKQTCLIFSFWDSRYCGLYRFK